MQEPESASQFAPEERDVPVWDLGIRFFHWALVILVTTSVVTIKLDALTYHTWSGYGVLTLLVFRLLWGIFGGTHARFASFVAGPGRVLAYLKDVFKRDRHVGWLGHNPLGALSVLAMLAALLFQAVSGLFTNDDDFAFEGPLYKWAGKEISDRLTHWHHFNETIIYVLVGLARRGHPVLSRGPPGQPGQADAHRLPQGGRRRRFAPWQHRPGGAIAGALAAAVYVLVNAVKLFG